MLNTSGKIGTSAMKMHIINILSLITSPADKTIIKLIITAACVL
jgi:hypothetical protein